MNLPVPHAGLVHMPLALALLLPIAFALAWLSVHRQWLSPNIWYGVALFTIVQIVSIGLGLQSGETAEFTASAAHDAVETHEHAAEAFLYVWLALGLILIPRPWFHGRSFYRGLDLITIVLFALQLYFAFKVGHLGGDLVPR